MRKQPLLNSVLWNTSLPPLDLKVMESVVSRLLRLVNGRAMLLLCVQLLHLQIGLHQLLLPLPAGKAELLLPQVRTLQLHLLVLLVGNPLLCEVSVVGRDTLGIMSICAL